LWNATIILPKCFNRDDKKTSTVQIKYSFLILNFKVVNCE